jgi:hypothetical protein
VVRLKRSWAVDRRGADQQAIATDTEEVVGTLRCCNGQVRS